MGNKVEMLRGELDRSLVLWMESVSVIGGWLSVCRCC